MRTTLIALAVLAVAVPAAAEPFPHEGEPWHYEGRTPASAGVARFLRLDATPDRRGDWTVTMTCGTVSLRTGREVVTYRGSGTGGRGRQGWLGGTTVSPDLPTLGWLIEQIGDGVLDQAVQAAAPGEDTVCPNGRGDLSSGD